MRWPSAGLSLGRWHVWPGPAPARGSRSWRGWPRWPARQLAQSSGSACWPGRLSRGGPRSLGPSANPSPPGRVPRRSTLPRGRGMARPAEMRADDVASGPAGAGRRTLLAALVAMGAGKAVAQQTASWLSSGGTVVWRPCTAAFAELALGRPQDPCRDCARSAHAHDGRCVCGRWPPPVLDSAEPASRSKWCGSRVGPGARSAGQSMVTSM